MRSSNKYGKWNFLGAISIVGVVIAFVLILLNLSVKDNLRKNICSTLEEIMTQQAYNFTSELRAEMSFIKMLAEVIAPDGKPSEVLAETLKGLVESGSSFETLAVADREGNALNSNGVKVHVGDRRYFNDAIAGRVTVSDPYMSRLRPVRIITIAAPIRHGGETVGVLFGSYTADKLNELFLSSFEGKGYAYITNNDGVKIAETTNDFNLSKSDNLFSDWSKMNFYAFDDLDKIRRNVFANKSGHTRFEMNGQKRLMHYGTIGVNDWNIFSVAPDEVVSVTSDEIVHTVYTITLMLSLLLGVLLYWLANLQKRHIKQISDLAFIDDLTNAPTIAKFKLEMRRIVEENPNSKFVIIKNDIDRFKLINRVLGFEEGDRVLRNAAKAMSDSLSGSNETYARVNSDEFLGLHEFVSEENFAEKHRMFIDNFYKYMGADFSYNVNFPSGHYYMKSEDSSDIMSAIEKANIAQRKAKSLGVEACIYDDAIVREAVESKDIENRMEEALRNKEFKMFLQPKRYLSDESMAGAEALVRWQTNGKTIKQPSEFVPLFEKNGFVVKLDMYMFGEACSFIRELIDEGKKPIAISVNFSRLHLRNESFIPMLCEIADKHGVPRQYLEIEITETAIFDNENVLLEVFEKLHAAGFTLSMDDFGTGYSSLGMLRNIPFDVIKIDRSFFLSAPNSGRAKTVLLNVIKMVKELGMHTVAEGVELKEHVELLRNIGCDIVQGYYYSKPMPADEFRKII